MGILLTALAIRLPLGLVPAQCLLLHLAPRFYRGNLFGNLVLNRPRECLKAVQVFDLNPCVEFFAPLRPNAHIRLKANNPLLHIAAVYAQIAQNVPNLGGIGQGFLGRTHVWLADNFQQGHARSVVIHQRRAIFEVG